MACLCDPSLGRASLDHADVGPVSRKVRQRRLSVRQLADRPISRCSPWERCGLGLRRGETFIAFVVVVVAVIGPLRTADTDTVLHVTSHPKEAITASSLSLLGTA